MKRTHDRCDGCDRTIRLPRSGPPGTGRLVCPSCTLYNAAVSAQRAAASSIAIQFNWRAKDAWLNESGVWAFVDGVCVQVATAEEAKPFAQLTSAARAVRFNEDGSVAA